MNGLEIRCLAYAIFGEEAENQGTGDEPKYTYTGKEHDATGLYYYGARYYDPALSRFITADTVYDAGPQGLNRYAYALNNPIIYRDPTGHFISGPDDENNPGAYESITGSQEQFAEGTATVHDGGYGGFNQTLTEYEQDESTLAERTFRRWLATDPRMRVGFSQPGQVLVPPEYNEYIMNLGGAEDQFLLYLSYLHEIGEDLNAYSIAELDNTFVMVRTSYSRTWPMANLGIQCGSTIGKARMAAKASQGKILWGSWSDYPKVTINGEEYAKVGDRLYSRHAVDRMQPSGMRYSGQGSGSTGGMPQIRQTGGNYDYGRGVAPQYVEDVITSTLGTVQPNGNISHVSGSLEVIVNPQGAVVTIMTH